MLYGSQEPDDNLMTDDLYRRFCSIIHDKTGLSFNEKSRYFLEKRLQMRLTAHQMGSAADYLSYLQFDPDRVREWDFLISSVTTNETYFMREERQLRCFQKEVLPRLIKAAGQRKIRIWSAGCSSGEEPYTLAILIHESKAVSPSMVEIYASDINQKVIDKAKAGIYGENSFRSVDAAFKAQWFHPENGGKLRIRDDVKQMVTFTRLNLFDPDRYALLSSFDTIFCRNVIIYFDLEAKVKVIDRFFGKLRPGGFLLLGHSESLISVTDKFKLVHLETDLVYTKEES